MGGRWGVLPPRYLRTALWRPTGRCGAVLEGNDFFDFSIAVACVVVVLVVLVMLAALQASLCDDPDAVRRLNRRDGGAAPAHRRAPRGGGVL